MITEKQPDLVLLDVMLPDISGLEAFQNIKRLDPRLPVIFITAGGTSDTAIEAVKVGAYDYLLKPLDMEQVRENRATSSRNASSHEYTGQATRCAVRN